jgi:hypothetical protein
VVETERPVNTREEEPSLHAKVVILPHEPLKTSTYVVARERLLPPPIPLNVIETAVAVADVVKRNHLSYVVEAPVHEPGTPSLRAFFILYVAVVQPTEGVIVLATVAQVSAPGVCADKIVGIQMKRITIIKKRIGDKHLIVWILACFKDWTFYFLLPVKIA